MNINEIGDNQGKYKDTVPVNNPWTDQNDIDWADCD